MSNLFMVSYLRANKSFDFEDRYSSGESPPTNDSHGAVSTSSASSAPNTYEVNHNTCPPSSGDFSVALKVPLMQEEKKTLRELPAPHPSGHSNSSSRRQKKKWNRSYLVIVPKAQRAIFHGPGKHEPEYQRLKAQQEAMLKAYRDDLTTINKLQRWVRKFFKSSRLEADRINLQQSLADVSHTSPENINRSQSFTSSSTNILQLPVGLRSVSSWHP
jgi:hypothetical protein